MHNATLCLCINEVFPPEILLGLKKTGFGSGKVTGLGGKLKTGENYVTAALREVREESGLILAGSDLKNVAQLLFYFPSRPGWDHAVLVFITRRWAGTPIETAEIKPQWYKTDQLPYDQMWPDARYWLPPIITGQKFKAQFVYNPDCATLASYSLAPWQADY